MNISDLLVGGSAWWIVPVSLLVFGATFGLLPGLMLRLLVQLYPKDHPRREELFGELYGSGMGRFERFEWVFQQLETAFRQGPALRKLARKERQIEGHADESNEEADVVEVEVDTEGVSSHLSDNHGLKPEDSYNIGLPVDERLLAAAQRAQQLLIAGNPGQGKTIPSTLFPGNRSFRLDSPDEIDAVMDAAADADIEAALDARCDFDANEGYAEEE